MSKIEQNIDVLQNMNRLNALRAALNEGEDLDFYASVLDLEIEPIPENETVKFKLANKKEIAISNMHNCTNELGHQFKQVGFGEWRCIHCGKYAK